MIRHWVAFAAVFSIIGCDQHPSGAEMLTRTAQLIVANNLTEAEELTEPRPVKEISHLDPTDPAYCSEAGVKTRVDYMAQNLSHNLLVDAKQFTDPLIRYAVIKRDVDRELSSQSDSIEYLCPYRQATLELAFHREITPISLSAGSLVADLRKNAAAVTDGDLDAAAAKVLRDHEKRERTDFAAECRRRRAAPPTLDNPLIARAEKLLLENCGRAGF